MTPEDKKLWVEALRSGKYEQGYKTLKTEDGKYCCLGVACEVFGIKIPSGPIRNQGLSYDKLLDRFQVATIFLFYIKNDTDKLTFNEIADFIEAEY